MNNADALAEFVNYITKTSQLSREIVGLEKDRLLDLLQLMNPVYTSNNQHSMTNTYRIGNAHYDVTYIDDQLILEEINNGPTDEK